MPTITVTDLAADLMERIRKAAERNGLSVEEEVRRALSEHFLEPSETKAAALDRMRERARRARPVSAETAERIAAEVRRGGS